MTENAKTPISPEILEERRLLVERLHKLDAEADLEPDDGYDLVEELNKHRRGMGARLISLECSPHAPREESSRGA